MNKRTPSRAFLVNTTAIVLLALTYAGCAARTNFSPGKGNKYQYTYKMVAPVANSNLLFQDDSLIVQFKFDEAAVKFQLQNVSQSNVVLEWSKASVGVNGRFYGIRHSGTLYADTSLKQSSMLIPPMGYIRDLAIPFENIYFDGNQWIETDLLPTVDNNALVMRRSIEGSVGTPVSFQLPVAFGTSGAVYAFEFQVASVTQIPWKDYVPVKRVPAPPIPHKQPFVLDQVTTAAIAVGVLGFTAFIINGRKDAPKE